MEHLVEIREDHTDDCDVYRDKKDTIKWKNGTDTDYKISFKGECPLQENDFTVMAHKEKGPVALKGGITPGTYPYLIEPAGAAMAADPNVIVH